jgi:hypothetical protein
LISALRCMRVHPLPMKCSVRVQGRTHQHLS